MESKNTFKPKLFLHKLQKKLHGFDLGRQFF